MAKFDYFPPKEVHRRLFKKHGRYMRRVRQIIGYLPDEPFPRCPCKSWTRLQKLALQGDFSHHPKDHKPCRICQCRNVAGYGTRGYYWSVQDDDELWWYVGHYGVGFCKDHEWRQTKRRQWDRADRHVRALRRYAWAREAALDFDIVARSEAAEVVRNEQLRRNIGEIQNRLDDALSVLRRESQKNAEIVAALGRLESAVRAQEEMFPPEQYNEILDAVESRIWRESRLTEPAGGKVVEMTDKTANEQLLKLALGISKLNLDDVKIRSEDMIPAGELVKRLPMLLDLITNSFRKVHQKWIGFDQDSDNMSEILHEIEQNFKGGVRSVFQGIG